MGVFYWFSLCVGGQRGSSISAREYPRVRSNISVRLPGGHDRSYRIHLQPGLFAELPKLLKRYESGDGLFVITDSNVERLYGRRLLRDLVSTFPGAMLFDFPAGEPSKSIRYYSSLVGERLLGRDRTPGAA